MMRQNRPQHQQPCSTGGYGFFMSLNPARIDPRGVRFAGVLSTLVAASAALLTSPWIALAGATILLSAAWGGSRLNLWGHIYRATLRRWLGPPGHLEPETPVRFAQLLGGLFLLVAGAAFLAGGPGIVVGAVLAGIVAVLALVNAAFDVCIGCRMYGLLLVDTRLPRWIGIL